MICVKFTAFCDLLADLRIRLATLHKSVRKFCFCKLVSTCESIWPGLQTLRQSWPKKCRKEVACDKIVACKSVFTEFLMTALFSVVLSIF